MASLNPSDPKWDNAILFCGRDAAKYPWLSNFYVHPLIDSDAREWRTAEHYYQALKFEDKLLQEEIRKVRTPKQAKELAHLMAPASGRKDWLEVRINMMRIVLRRKFADPELRDKLENTGGKWLVEHRLKDGFWGCGPRMTGHNWLGKLLMEIRDEV